MPSKREKRPFTAKRAGGQPVTERAETSAKKTRTQLPPPWIKMAACDQRLPVTLLSGFLGSGKTTLLRKILGNRANLKVAVIVNDMAELNIDAALISSSASLVQCEEKLISLSNGCICCTLREDLLQQVAQLASEAKFDLLVIESTGISEPMQVAETFYFPLPLQDLPAQVQQQLVKLLPAGHQPSENDAEKTASKVQAAGATCVTVTADATGSDKGQQASSGSKYTTRSKAGDKAAPQQSDAAVLSELQLSDWVRLDTCVTVVDAAVFMDNLHSIEDLKDRFDAEVPLEDERSISNLLLDQIEFADVILLNKTDLLRPDSSPSNTAGNGSSRSRSRSSTRRASSRSAAHDAAVQRLVAMLQLLNPRAKVIPAVRCNVELQEVLLTQRFDMQQAAQAPGWLSLLKAASSSADSADYRSGSKSAQLSQLLKGVQPETDEYGISSFVYKARRPFHPGRLYSEFVKRFFLTKVIQAAPLDHSDHSDSESDEEAADESSSESEETGSSDEGEDAADAAEKESLAHYEATRQEVLQAQRSQLTAEGCLLRSKGFVWLASSSDRVVEWSSSGLLLELSASHPWFCTVPEAEWPEDAAAQIRADFSTDNSIGDRRQELVFIGQDLKLDVITTLLDSCLLTDAEMAAGKEAAAWLSEDPLFGPDE